MTAVLALSLSSEIEKYGAYAGIAAVVGLGVLSLLYFAQAREVKRLREWAGRAPERDADLQQRVVAEAQVRTTAPQARPRPAGPATPAGVAAAKPAAPAAGAPSVLAAHPGTPTGAKPPVPATAAAAAATGAAAGAVVAGAKPAAAAAAAPPASTTVPASKTAPGPAPAPAGPAAATAAATPGTPPPATAAAQAPPASPTPAPVTTPVAPSASAPSASAPSASAVPPPPADPPLAATPTPTPPPPRSRPRPAAAPVRATRPDAGVASRAGAEPPRQGSRRGLLGVVLGGVAIIAIAVLLITQVFSGGSDNSSTPKPNSVGTPAATTPADGTKTPQPNRAGTRVAVLNGTPVAGLARAAADKLTAIGYKDVGPVATDTTNQARATTVVYWQSGTRREGLDVAKALGLGRAALQVMDQNARVLGGGASVVVVVGADQAK